MFCDVTQKVLNHQQKTIEVRHRTQTFIRILYIKVYKKINISQGGVHQSNLVINFRPTFCFFFHSLVSKKEPEGTTS